MSNLQPLAYPLELTVNGRRRAVAIAPYHTLLEVLRDDLGLTGSKECCLVGECGACTVILDGRSVDACLVLATEADGGEVLTVEGLAGDGQLSALQQAFLDYGAAQCGFCIPGQLISAHALLERIPHPTHADVEEALAGNLCRCAGYEQIIEAVMAAAEGRAGHSGDGGAEDRHGLVPAVDYVEGFDPAATPDAQNAPQ